MIALKPCPCCGGEAILTRIEAEPGKRTASAEVRCKCGINIPRTYYVEEWDGKRFRVLDDAIETVTTIWNTRPNN